MIKFFCPNCKQKLGVPDSYAGRRIRCNACSKTSIVPKLTCSTAAPTQLSPPKSGCAENSNSSDNDLLTAGDFFGPKTGDSYHFSQTDQPRTAAENSRSERKRRDLETPTDTSTPPNDELRLMPTDPTPPPDPEEEKIRLASIKRAQEKSQEPVEIVEFPDDRVVENPPGYWPFAFPLRGPGLGMIGIFVAGSALIIAAWFFQLYRLIRFRHRSSHHFLTLIFGGYFCWYLNLCIQTTATGKVSSPDVIAESEGDRFELAAQVIRLFLTIALSLVPAIGYSIWFMWYSGAPRDVSPFTNSVFWCLIAGGLFFLPMNLLSMILHDSLTGLNPILIIDSIRRTIGQYLILLVWFFTLLGLAVIIPWFLYRFNIWLMVSGLAFSFYCLMVSAAIMGRFFYRNEKQLDWEV